MSYRNSFGLTLEVTGSGSQLGLVVAVQFLPILLFGFWGGMTADRFDKRKILIWTQAAFGVGAVIGGLYAASRHKLGSHQFIVFGLLFGASIIATGGAAAIIAILFGSWQLLKKDAVQEIPADAQIKEDEIHIASQKTM